MSFCYSFISNRFLLSPAVLIPFFFFCPMISLTHVVTLPLSVLGFILHFHIPFYLSFAPVFHTFWHTSPSSSPRVSGGAWDSVGTREGVVQKNLSGLLPVRDIRLDPSLLYSLPLLALSPHLLLVWLCLSLTYLLARLRCS